MSESLLDRLKDDTATFTASEVMEIVDIYLKRDEHKRTMNILEEGLRERQAERMDQIKQRREEVARRMEKRRAVKANEQDER